MDMDIEFLPNRYSDAAFLRGAMAVRGTTDLRGIGILTTIEMFTPIDFKCQWEPYVTDRGLIIVYFTFPSRESYLVFAIDDFLDKIKVV
jgi:hypothetical protein